ncbi:unnamed protein product [Sphagnum compactum]
MRVKKLYIFVLQLLRAIIVVSRNEGNNCFLQSGCGSGNPIDDCWRCDPNWENNRQNLADCALGFGSKAVGGQGGQIYIVTDNSDNDTVNPAPGTLRYGVTQAEPLWIIFASDMNLTLKEELIMSSFKTIDGRGFDIHIAGGACLTLEYVTHVIVHGVHIHDCISTGPAVVRSNSTHFGQRGTTDGDAVNIFGSQDIWVDHCYFANCADGLVDVIMGSTDITVSNNYFTDHDKVMLLGAHPNDTMDGNLRVTVAFNHFGANLTQRLPRCRHGFFHVVNNDYTSWGIYAVGGSEAPTINSEGNRYSAPNVSTSKEVTMRIDDGGSDFGSANTWNWTSSGDLFLNGAFFTPSGARNSSFWNSTIYDTQATSFVALPSTMVGNMTADAGPISYCQVGGAC